MMTQKIGLLFVNLGSPSAPTPKAIRRFLREFLLDGRVVDIPAPLRYLLVYGAILPFRPKAIAPLYQSIWKADGSPLHVYSQQLVDKMNTLAPEHVQCAMAMRYGEPSMASAMQRLLDADVAKIILVPMFPQYAESTTGSVIAKAFELMSQQSAMIPLIYRGDFYDQPFFIDSLASLYQPLLHDFSADHVLLSYHGLPVRQLNKIDANGMACADERECPILNADNRYCYRAQCFATSRALTKKLALSDQKVTTVFQSEFGKAKWIGPNITKVLQPLIDRGVKRLAVACPSFVADCLETEEEIGVRLREDWLELGGDALLVLPSINADAAFAAGILRWALEV